ncbi:ATP-binding cassette domain-containing protein [Pyrobaculum ferrireducens]|uniref:ATP-binding cassette domain-containing protein n=1 Tax=Pyrobaculum ferrireducens TaxID=1104324 RepID=UPI001F4546CF|nr:ABC transporter ATP-binding protein [Pyrobaculum ferrireducens]
MYTYKYISEWGDVIEAVDVWKRLGGGWVLRGLTLRVNSVVTLVGPNGSGKTTLVRIIAGVLEPTRGEVYVDGRRPKVPASLLGVVFHNPMLYPELTVRENLKLFGKMAGGRLEGCPLGVCKVLNKPVKALSFGWRRRVDIVRALLPDPPNLVIDEPTTGLDEEARGELLDILRQRSAALLTSPFPLGVGVQVGIEEVQYVGGS